MKKQRKTKKQPQTNQQKVIKFLTNLAPIMGWDKHELNQRINNNLLNKQ